MKFQLEYFLGKKSCWEFLKETDLPIFIYGMGDGCLKILSRFEQFSIACAGIFASDEFVRGHSFQGHVVHKLSEIERNVGEFVIVLAFAAGYPSLIERIDEISKKHLLLAPDVPVIDDGTLFTKEFLKEHFCELERVYNHLADELSQRVFVNTLECKITGDISLLREIATLPSESYNDILRLGENEIYVDLGAYNGDTVTEFLEFVGWKYKKIIALEPNARNFRKLSVATQSLENCELYNSAVWSCDTILTFSSGGGRQSKVSDKGVETSARSVDSVLDGDPATYIKYDVEGAEMTALDGASATISNFSPKLCVALYHRNEDIFALPLRVLELQPQYKLFMRHYPYYPAWETNLFAVL